MGGALDLVLGLRNRSRPVCVWEGGYETHRQEDIQSQAGRQTGIEKERQRQTDRLTDRLYVDRLTDRLYVDTWRVYTQTERQTETDRDRQTERQTQGC